MLIILITLTILIILSAFFSGSETAFMNLKLHRKGVPAHLKAILNNEKLFLTSVLSANTVVNISIAVLAAQFTHEELGYLEISPYLKWVIEIFVIGMMILLFGEIIFQRPACRDTKNPSIKLTKEDMTVLSSVIGEISLRKSILKP